MRISLKILSERKIKRAEKFVTFLNDRFFVKIARKSDGGDKNERIRHKLAKVLQSQEECASKLLKIFTKKLDEIQTVDRQLATIRNV